VSEPEQLLTDLELQVLRDIADGFTAGRSAKRLFMSEDGIRGVRRRIYELLRARNGPHAVAIAVRKGLI
jgi:DNA-binding CsgD family transcriptional regulator